MEAQQKFNIQKNSWIGEKIKVLGDGVSAQSDMLLLKAEVNIKNQK